MTLHRPGMLIESGHRKTWTSPAADPTSCTLCQSFTRHQTTFLLLRMAILTYARWNVSFGSPFHVIGIYMTSAMSSWLNPIWVYLLIHIRLWTYMYTWNRPLLQLCKSDPHWWKLIWCRHLHLLPTLPTPSDAKLRRLSSMKALNEKVGTVVEDTSNWILNTASIITLWMFFPVISPTGSWWQLLRYLHAHGKLMHFTQNVFVFVSPHCNYYHSLSLTVRPLHLHWSSIRLLGSR